MLRVLASGLIGGVVLVVWSVVFSLLGPARSERPDRADASAAVAAMGDAFSDLVRHLPVGPAEASASTGRGEAAEAEREGLELAGIARGLGVACASGVFAAVLMSVSGAGRRSFAERVMFAVLLGAFAACAMMVPDGGWLSFSLSRATPVWGEVLIGWLLAGMVIAVMLSPRPPQVKAS